MARHAEDLDLALRALAGPDLLQQTAWQVELPLTRRRRLGEFRVAVWASSPLCRIDTSVSDLFDRAIDAIVRAGATVDDVIEIRKTITLRETVFSPERRREFA
jgi:amidase